VDLVGHLRIGERERCRVHGAALHRRVHLGRGGGGLDRAEHLHGVAQASARAYALAFPVGERGGQLALAEEFVLRQQRRGVGHGVPVVHVGDERRVLEELVSRLHRHVPVAERQERQRKHHERRVLAGVVEVAEMRGVDGLELEAVEVLPVLGERLRVADADGEVAAALLGHEVGQHFDALGKRAFLAPGGELPFHFLRGGSCGYGRQRDRERGGNASAGAFHDVSSSSIDAMDGSTGAERPTTRISAPDPSSRRRRRRR
jgi:hypothetical protein